MFEVSRIVLISSACAGLFDLIVSSFKDDLVIFECNKAAVDESPPSW